MIFVIFATVLPAVAYFLIYYLHLPIFFVVGSPLLLFLSPILEEIVFRGLIQDYIFEKISNKTLVVIITNLLFIAFHYHINSNFLYLLTVFICGVIFSLFKIRFSKLYYPICCHLYYNLCFYLYYH